MRQAMRKTRPKADLSDLGCPNCWRSSPRTQQERGLAVPTCSSGAYMSCTCNGSGCDDQQAALGFTFTLFGNEQLQWRTRSADGSTHSLPTIELDQCFMERHFAQWVLLEPTHSVMSLRLEACDTGVKRTGASNMNSPQEARVASTSGATIRWVSVFAAAGAT
jgi:hypothetical protein